MATHYKGTVTITPQDVQKFVSSRLTGGRNATTVVMDLKTLNAPFALAMRRGEFIFGNRRQLRHGQNRGREQLPR